MKKYYLRGSFALFLIITLLFQYNGLASAHVLKEDNGVSAVLHIPPDDNPVAARSTTLDFSFNSDSGNFGLVDCNCQVSIQSNGKKLQTVPLERPPHGGTLDASSSVKFPIIGVYDVIVTGSSKTAKFQPFTLDYVERVATTSAANTPKNTNSGTVLLLGAASFVLLAMIAYAAIDRGGRYKKKLKH